MSELMNITVLVAGRPYPLKIHPQEEHLIRRVVKEINTKINQYQLTFKQRDKQDCIAMALLTYAVEAAQKPVVAASEEDTLKRLQHLEYLLDQSLAE